MRAVIEKEVLQEVFSGAFSEIFITAHSAVLGVTPAIISEYLNISDGAGMFKEWFDKTFSTQNNYFLVSPDSLSKYELDAACLQSNYVGAAYHNSGPVIAESTSTFNKLAPCSWGVPIINAKDYKFKVSANQAGAKVAEIFSLKPKGTESPEILKKYILKENRIFIFDKSINFSGADFICELTKYCAPRCKIVVMSNFNSCASRGLMSLLELQKYINSRKVNGTVEVLQASRETIGLYHDRFIFLGDRFQISFSSGVDCFGRPPAWINTDGDITIHCVHNSSESMEFDAGARKKFKLKSKG